MKLNTDCISAVLMAIEEAVTYYDKFQYIAGEKVPDRLNGYSHDEIVYHVQHCAQCNYLVGCDFCGNGAMIFVEDLSKDGHMYLANIRSESTWGQIKQAFADYRGASMKKLPTVLCQIMWKAIKPSWWPN